MRPRREQFRQSGQTYFVTFQTAQRQYFFRNERWAQLLLNILERYAENYGMHDFVIMPDHVHALLSPNVPLEKVVQLMKGGFSFQARRAFEWNKDVWQAGFTDHRIRDDGDWQVHISYIEKNVRSLKQEAYKFCALHAGLPLSPCPQWLKPLEGLAAGGGAEAPPFQNTQAAIANLSSTEQNEFHSDQTGLKTLEGFL